MSKEKEFEKELPLLLRMKALDLMLWVHYRTLKHLHNISTVKIIHSFKDLFDVSEEELTDDTAKQILNRINNNLKNNSLWQSKK